MLDRQRGAHMASLDRQDLEPMLFRTAYATSSDVALRWAGRALVAVVWISAALFALYIVAFYAGAISDGTPERWNQALPRLYGPHEPLATIGIGAHFATGAILLLLGPIQLIGAIRQRVPRLHRWLGRLYVTTALITGLGGLAFIAAKGTIGGAPMNIGFGLYGVLVVVAGAEAFRHARARRFDQHRAWAIRLFALVIGSWLYRMDYGIWRMLAHGVGHTKTFDGPFDIVMTFFFYVPNLIVAEAFIRGRELRASPIVKIAAALLLTGATVLIGIGTYYFTLYYWGPSIVARVFG
jgi:predicted membrane protein DUF2306